MVTHGFCTSARVLLVHELYFAQEELTLMRTTTTQGLRVLAPMLENPDDFVIWTNAVEISLGVSVLQ